MREIWIEVYGDDYPTEAEPFGFVTRDDLGWITEALAIGPGEILVDVGCGRGGPGLWVARAAGARLLGIDLIPEALAQAEVRAEEFAMTNRSSFRVASFADTGLAESSCGGVMSIDALQLVRDKPRAFREMARVLQPGRSWAFTTWEPPYFRYQELLPEFGFVVDSCDEPANWRPKQLAVYKLLLESQEELVKELGRAAASVLLAEAAEGPRQLATARRVRVKAIKTTRDV
jgi:ubiquinone/menaquinone biosynthesis C-methylase UbiE